MAVDIAGRFGFHEKMGPKLLEEITRQLFEDLKHYGIDPAGLSLDWSEICIEGSCTSYLDGIVDNYSGVNILDSNGEYIGDGWIEFVHELGDSPLYMYWDYLSFNNVDLKEKFGIPPHVWERLPRSAQRMYKRYKMPE